MKNWIRKIRKILTTWVRETYETNICQGFTMVELLISMALFVMFTTVVISSYGDIVVSQREANEFRKIYSEARGFFDEITSEIRDGVVYFDGNEASSFNSGVSLLTLISKDGQTAIRYWEDEGKINVKENFRCGQQINEYQINSDEILVDELSFYITPAFDPYLSDNVIYNSLQFQPKVTIFARFKRIRDDVSIDFQTTISSRYYSQTPEIDFTCIN